MYVFHEFAKFDILIADILWTVAQTPINHIIFLKSVFRTFICIYVNCFSRLRFLAEVSTKLRKMNFFRQFRGHNSGRKLDKWAYFSFPFSALTVCSIHFCIWKWSKFIFMWSPFGLFWFLKYLNFREKLPIFRAHHTYVKSIHPGVTKNSYYVLSPKGSQKNLSPWTIKYLIRLRWPTVWYWWSDI